MMVVLLLLLQLAAPGALSPEATSREGAEALRVQSAVLAASGDTTGAIAALDASLSGGWKSPQALLALGRLHLAQGNPGSAVLALERAARLAPADVDIATARNAAYALARQAPPNVPPPFVASRAVTSRIGAGLLVVLALTLYLGTLLLGAFWRRQRHRQPAPLAGWAALGLASLALGALILAGLALWDAGQPRAVALVTVDVRERPAPEAAGAGAIRAGEVVDVGETRGLWRRVETGNAEGWVPARAVERL